MIYSILERSYDFCIGGNVRGKTMEKRMNLENMLNKRSWGRKGTY